MLRLAVLALAILGLAACMSGRRTGPAVLVERYCYRTLGVVDCHAAPLAGEGYRLVGFFDAPSDTPLK
jgi:hypothetical protein